MKSEKDNNEMTGKEDQAEYPCKEETSEQSNPAVERKADQLNEGVQGSRIEKFNGIQGTLPEWMPDPLKHEFMAIRESLLRWMGSSPDSPICPICNNDKMEVAEGILCCPDCGASERFNPQKPAHEKIMDFMKLRREHLEKLTGLLEKYSKLDVKCPPDLMRHHYYPVQHSDKLDALNYIYNLFSLGKEEALKTYLGQGERDVYRGMVFSQRAREVGE